MTSEPLIPFSFQHAVLFAHVVSVQPNSPAVAGRPAKSGGSRRPTHTHPTLSLPSLGIISTHTRSLRLRFEYLVYTDDLLQNMQ